MNDYNDSNSNSNAWLIAEIRKLHNQIKKLESGSNFIYRDVLEYINMDLVESLTPVLYYKGSYYDLSNRSAILKSMKLNNDEVKPNTFRNWVKATPPNTSKLALHQVSLEYIHEFHKNKFISTRGDVLNKNLTITKYPIDKNEFTIRIDGRNKSHFRHWLVFKAFIDPNIEYIDDIFFSNGRFEDCDVSNLVYKSDLADIEGL